MEQEAPTLRRPPPLWLQLLSRVAVSLLPALALLLRDAEQGVRQVESSEGPALETRENPRHKSDSTRGKRLCLYTYCLPSRSFHRLQLLSLCSPGGNSSLTSSFHQKGSGTGLRPCAQ